MVTCICYLVDVIVLSPTLATHLLCLSAILTVFQRVGMQLNCSKWHFGRRQISALGHHVSAARVQPDPHKIRAVQMFLFRVPPQT